MSTPTSATVVSTDSRLVNFYWKAQSGNYTGWSDSADWAFMCFAAASISGAGDGWDVSYPYWILAGTDNSYDPATYSNVVVGKPAAPSSTAGAHWWGSTSTFQTNSGTFYTKTFVWLK